MLTIQGNINGTYAYVVITKARPATDTTAGASRKTNPMRDRDMGDIR